MSEESEKVLKTVAKIVANVASKTKKKFRTVFGTISKKDPDFKGTEEEKIEIRDILKNSSKQYERCVIGAERYVEPPHRIHYHFAMYLRGPMANTLVDKLRADFKAYCNGDDQVNQIEQSGNWNKATSYVSKESDADNPLFCDNCKVDARTVQTIRASVEQTKEVCGEICEKPTLKVLHENKVVSIVKQFMDDHGYSINRRSRYIKNCPSLNHFYKQLEEETKLSERHGKNAIDLVEKYVEDFRHNRLPSYDLDEGYIEFKDCFWCFNSNSKVPKEDLPGVIAVKRYLNMPCPNPDFTLPERPAYVAAKEAFDIFKSVLEKEGISVEDFRIHYGRQFQSKIKNIPPLLLYGMSDSGKSLVTVPFLEIFREVLGWIVPDGKYLLGSLAMCTKYYSDEYNPRAQTGEIADLMKNLADGDPNTKVPHKNSGTVPSLPKTGMTCSNSYECYDDAINRKIKSFEFNNKVRVSPLDVDIRMKTESLIKKCAPFFAVWATANNPQVIFDYDEDDDFLRPSN